MSQPVTPLPFLCIVNPNENLKPTTMGTTCKIRCKHCGARFDNLTRSLFGLRPSDLGCGYVETEIPIRCPVCRGRLNDSQEEFDAQIEPAPLLDPFARRRAV